MKDVKPTVTAESLRRSGESVEDPEKAYASSHEDEKARAKDDVAAQAALAALVGDSTIEPITEDEKKKILRKIDCCLLPLMCLAVLLQFLDK